MFDHCHESLKRPDIPGSSTLQYHHRPPVLRLERPHFMVNGVVYYAIKRDSTVHIGGIGVKFC